MTAHLITRDEPDETRRRLAFGRARGGSPLLQMRARFGDLQATGTREAAARRDQGIEAVRQAGYRAWEQREETGS